MSKFPSVLVIAVALCISGLKADDKPEHTAECIAKSGATEADVFARPRKESPEIRCFWKCIMEKDGMLDASGVLNPDMFETSFPKAAAKLDAQSITDLKKCLGAVGKITTCEDTTKIRDCIVKAFKQ
ncbi:general odorant-binding protein 19d-like [Diabrotica undecimpunctata]|uniref:general odorant-binding protein 19d-like n=1 Tax=Diabrotica undecimpunctata TaxID=50387 RepID=UPI003B63C3B3